MGILYNRLLIILNEEHSDSTYYHIAITMLKHIEELSVLAINEIADLCAVSKSTISKFIRFLGYEDYWDFRYAATFRENKYSNTSNYITNVMGYMESHTMDEYVNTIKCDIEETYRNLDWNAVDRLVHDLIRYDKVAAFGLMFSETAAIDLQTKLAYNKKFIVTNINDLKQDDYIRNAGEDTLIIIFSESGKYIERYLTIDDFICKNEFEVTKAKVVLITSEEEMIHDPRVDDCILFRKTEILCTHRIIYRVLTDIIAFKYRELSKNK